ncbi:MAG: DUF4864 domain-containing protein [Chroococcales cyanobacterium]
MYVTDSDRVLIRSIIEQQLQAFLQDDGERAFAFATPAIQQLFDTPDNFMRMVKISYPQLYRPRSVLFEEMTTFQGMLTQPVLVLGADDIPVRAMYWMDKPRNGSWGINGCYLLPVRPEN